MVGLSVTGLDTVKTKPKRGPVGALFLQLTETPEPLGVRGGTGVPRVLPGPLAFSLILWKSFHLVKVLLNKKSVPIACTQRFQNLRLLKLET